MITDKEKATFLQETTKVVTPRISMVKSLKIDNKEFLSRYTVLGAKRGKSVYVTGEVMVKHINNMIKGFKIKNSKEEYIELDGANVEATYDLIDTELHITNYNIEKVKSIIDYNSRTFTMIEAKQVFREVAEAVAKDLLLNRRGIGHHLKDLMYNAPFNKETEELFVIEQGYNLLGDGSFRPKYCAFTSRIQELNTKEIKYQVDNIVYNKKDNKIILEVSLLRYDNENTSIRR